MRTVDEIMGLVDEFTATASNFYLDGGTNGELQAEGKVQYAALRAAIETLAKDAECFRFWVREAANSPGAMVSLIAKCTTEQEYRDAIIPIAFAAEKAIDAAMQGEQK